MRRNANKAPSVAIIGAGLSGIGLAVRLKRAGLTDFEVFDRAAGPGGTWWHNRYPGVAVDVPSSLYSYSFKKAGNWKRAHATGEELRGYIEDVIAENGIGGHFRYEAEVTALRWQEAEQHWDVVFATGETRRFQVVVPAVGMLDTPRYPALPGMADFEGPLFHTARWEDHDLAGKRVAYVGGGSTAAQVVPALAGQVGQLDVYQRSPHWALPKDDPEISELQRRRLRGRPWLLWRERWRAFKLFESLGAANEAGNTMAPVFEGIARQLLEVVEDDAVRDALTPDYPIMCKRPILTSPEYFAAFNHKDVALVPKAVAGFTADGVIDADGVERKADAVILSTGFQATNYLATIEVTGRDGERLKDLWERSHGPYAFLGMLVPRFPNLLIMYGPNSNVVQSTIFVQECQAKFITRVLKRMARRRWRTVQVRPWAAEAARAWIDSRLSTYVASVGGCSNWMLNEHGKVVTLFPGNGKLWWALTRFSDPVAVVGGQEAARHAAPATAQVADGAELEVPRAA